MVLVAGIASLARADEPNGPVAAQPAAGPAQTAPQRDAKSGSPSAPALACTDSIPASPKIVIHENAAPANASDARVQVGGIKISMPPWTSQTIDQTTDHKRFEAPPSLSANEAIAVPANTLGPGEPYWRVQERADSERRLADARVALAEADAQRASRQASRNRGYIFVGNSYLNDGRRGHRYGLRGPVTTTTTYSDQLGSTAQQAFAKAAYPRLNGTTNARDAIVNQFGRDASPPIVRIQNDVDAIHRKANSEHPK